MFFKFFRSSYLSQYILLFILGIILWSKSFIAPTEITEANSIAPFFSIIPYWLDNLKWLAAIIAFILLYFESLLLNKTLADNNIVPKTTLIPAFVYFVFMSWSPFALTLHPVLIANLFLIFVLNNLFRVYGQQDAFRLVFKAGFLSAIASFFYFPAIFIIVLIFISLMIFRIFKWREWIISLIGLIIPYTFLTVYYLWFDKLEIMFGNYIAFFETLWQFKFSYDFFTNTIWIIILILFVISFIYIRLNIKEKNINIRKKLITTIYFFLITLIIFMSNSESINISITIIPVSILISTFLSEIKRTFWFELIFILLMVLIILNNYTALIF